MTSLQHREEAERLLTEAKRGAQQVSTYGAKPVQDINIDLTLIGQLISMAHVHAMLAQR